jgi:hypothetical protein
MKHHSIPRRPARGLLATLLLVLLLTSLAILPTAAEDILPISETESTTQPLGSTSVGLHTMPNRETALPVSYGLRVLAAREELVFAGLVGNELSFTAEDIRRSMNLSELNYITIRDLPNPGEGTLFVGSVGAAEGQVISAGSLSLLSFAAARESAPSESTMEISVNGSDYAVTCRLCMLDRLNYTPTVALAPAVTLNIETYKGIPTAGTVSAYDPEGDEITYEIIRYASHGRVSLTDRHTGAYLYTPDPAYTGQDSFDYVVRDRYGNYSTAATVTVQVTARPAAVSYADIDGEGNAAAILSVSAMGLMNGNRVGGETYFKPDAPMTRLEFLVTAMQAAGITTDTVAGVGDPAFADTAAIPTALRPFVTYASQKGYVNGKTVDGKLCFKPDETITRAEAAVILSNVIGYAVEDTVTAFADEAALPAWSGEALTSLRALGILQCPDGNAHAGKTLTRGDAAEWLDRTVQLMRG